MRKDNIPTALNAFRTNQSTLLRSLNELTLDSAETVLELIAQNSLYRGEEHVRIVKTFVQLKREFDAAKDKALFCWTKSGELGGDHQFGGKSCSDPLSWAWRGWQARNNLDSTEELTEKIDPKQTFQEIVPPYLKGDVILLNSGEGPKMVVSNFNVSNGLIYATWFVNGVIKSDYIHYAMVTKEKKSVK